MANNKKLDMRPQYIRELMLNTKFMGYKVTESGHVFNSKEKLVKPKFYFKGKRIDYVYIDITYKGKKQRISYHRFIYMAWNPDENLDGKIVTTIGRRFDYCINNLKCITKEEHMAYLAKHNSSYQDDDILGIVQTYEEVKDIMTKQDFAKRIQISPRTLNKYIRGIKDGV